MIVVIEGKEDEPPERFIFALGSMVGVQGYDSEHILAPDRSRLTLGRLAFKIAIDLTGPTL